ncbi:MAG: sulfatase-like hydrolase/transferase [Rubripirellula sp.]
MLARYFAKLRNPKTLAVTLWLLTAACCVHVRAESTDPPNVVLILADDLGYADLGCYGHPYARTPAIDRLASEGTRFSQFYVTGVTCNPSRTGLMTGLFPARFAKYAADFGFGDRVTITELLHSRGYRTGHFGKWHIGPDSTEVNGTYGIDRVRVIGKSRDKSAGRDDDLVGAAIDFMKANADQPFYLNVWGHSTHFPVDTPANLTEPFKDVYVDREDFSPPMQQKFDDCLQIGGNLNTSMRQYLGDVHSIDLNVDRILKAIDDLGLRDNTIVVFSSDHGPAPVLLGKQKSSREFSDNMLGYAGLFRGGKHEQLEGGIRAPFIVRWPGNVKAGRVDLDSVVSFIDWMPTLCSIAGIDDLPEQLDGEDVSDIWRGSNRLRKKPLFWKVSSSGGAPAMREGKWKLHLNGRRSDAEIELYDLSTDPSELENLADTQPTIAKRLKSTLKKWVTELPTTYVKTGEKEKKKKQRKKADRGTTSSGSDTSSAVLAKRVDPSTLTGKVMCGYQGWFNCEGDGANLGWKHWAKKRGSLFSPGNVTVDLWPEVSEYAPDELYSTGFRFANGQVAKVFSSADRGTVKTHFKWMQDYGIDGAFIQRFIAAHQSPGARQHQNLVLSHARAGAKQSGRTMAVMYDLSGLKAGQVANVQRDWLALQSEQQITNDEPYLHHEGRPVVAVWGIGFKDGRKYSLDECAKLVEWFKSQGCTVMLGVPSFWRELKRDAADDVKLHEIIQAADIVSPWSVGRYRTPEEAQRHAADVWSKDREWSESHQVDFLPVVFPGFSWHHLHGGQLNAIPRLKGQFLWSQIVGAKQAGCKMIYVAMFDEVDEGTAIFKCTNQPPTNDQARFMTYEGLPSDHYLKLVGEAGKALRDEIELTDVPPQ